MTDEHREILDLSFDGISGGGERGEPGKLEQLVLNAMKTLDEGEGVDITVKIRSEAWTSQTCPECGEREATTRHGDTMRCPCGFEGHADLTASETFLRTNSKRLVRSMARPVRFQWDNHRWRSTTDTPSSGTNPNEQRTNP